MIERPDAVSDLLGEIERGKDEVAREVTDEFLSRHSDWVERYGDRVRELGIEDAKYHMEFLHGAVASGSPASFRRYARWTADVLESRGIAPHFLEENLDQIRRTMAARVEPEAAELLDRYVDAGISGCSDPAETDGSSEGSAPREEIRKLYLEAALRGDRRAALTILREGRRQGMSVADLYLHVLQEAQYEVGRRWQANLISVAEEHTATMVCQYVLTRLYEDLPREAARRGRAIVTGVERELHQVGANMVADMLEMDGWTVRFLGTQMPHRGIVETVQEVDPQLVGISVTMLFNLPRVMDLIEEIRLARGGEERLILVGGGAFGADREAWKRVGANGFGGDLLEAVEEARRLHERPPPNAAGRSDGPPS